MQVALEQDVDGALHTPPAQQAPPLVPHAVQVPPMQVPAGQASFCATHWPVTQHPFDAQVPPLQQSWPGAPQDRSGGGIRSGIARSGMARSGMARSGIARSGIARSGIARSGAAPSRICRSGTLRSGMARSICPRSGTDRSPPIDKSAAPSPPEQPHRITARTQDLRMLP
jgi:hypothetical protein